LSLKCGYEVGDTDKNLGQSGSLCRRWQIEVIEGEVGRWPERGNCALARQSGHSGASFIAGTFLDVTGGKRAAGCGARTCQPFVGHLHTIPYRGVSSDEIPPLGRSLAPHPQALLKWAQDHRHDIRAAQRALAAQGPGEPSIQGRRARPNRRAEDE
jgi:hypothetical protein